MARPRNRYEVLEHIDLVKAAHTNASAERARQRCVKLKLAGHRVEIRHSRFNGFQVVDLDEFIPRRD